MKKGIIIFISIFFVVSQVTAQNINKISNKCIHGKVSINTAKACLQRSNFYEKTSPSLSLYFYREYYIKLPNSERQSLNEKEFNSKIKNFLDLGMKADVREKVCLTAAMLPQSIHSTYISDPNNTLDRSLVSQIGNFQTLLQSSNMGLGVQTAYNFHTLTNAIRLIYTRGDDIHIVMLLYFIGNSLDPSDPGKGMLRAFQQACRWNYHQGLEEREELPQYGTSLQLIDLIKANKLTPKTKKIVSALMTGDGDKAVKIMFEDQDEVKEAASLYDTVIRQNYCNFPY